MLQWCSASANAGMAVGRLLQTVICWHFYLQAAGLDSIVGLEFYDPVQSPFLTGYSAGRNSPYGEQVLLLLQSLAEQRGLDCGAYAQLYYDTYSNGFEGYMNASTVVSTAATIPASVLVMLLALLTSSARCELARCWAARLNTRLCTFSPACAHSDIVVSSIQSWLSADLVARTSILHCRPLPLRSCAGLPAHLWTRHAPSCHRRRRCTSRRDHPPGAPGGDVCW